MRWSFWPAVLCALFFVSCASQQKKSDLAFDSASLFGMIYDEGNQPCPGVQLFVDERPGPSTDIRGRFVIPELSRGDHAISCRRQGYEELRVTVAFLNRTDVLHLKMTSFEQLLSKAEEALREMKWGDAAAFLRRAEALDGEDDVLQYLCAIHDLKTRAPRDAEGHLEKIISRGHPEPHIFLLLADIHQYSLGDPLRAANCLEDYLRLRGDPEVERRLQELGEATAGGLPAGPRSEGSPTGGR
jgi:hypothetical protein